MTSTPPLSATGEQDRNAPWTAAQRAEEWAGELRVNLVRLLAIAVFYGHHLINYYVRGLEITPKYHLIVTGIAAAWVAASLALHMVLVHRRNRPYVKYAAVFWDTFMTTTLLVFSDGPQSPLLVLLFLIIMTASLRLHLRLVWVASLLVLLSYGFVCGHSKWKRPQTRAPVHHHVIFVLALGTAGLLSGQGVRQARRFARDYADRLKPPEEVADSSSETAEKGGAS